MGVVVLATVAGLACVTGTALAGGGGGSSEGHGSFALASFDWHFSKDGDGQVHGYFKAVATQPGGAFVAPEGPVTCAAFVGNKVGFLYPLEDNTKPAVAKGTVILITAEDNGGNGRDKIGFTGPLPAAAFHGCAPGAAPFDVTSGHTHVDSDSGGADEDSDH